MPLPWVRLDSNIASHDKILALIADPDRLKWQAVASYMFALGWSGAAGTDGRVPSNALAFVHGTTKTARLLVKYRLWQEAPGGFQIVNYDTRQQLETIAKGVKKAQSEGARRANCRRWHGENCWRNGECTTLEAS